MSLFSSLLFSSLVFSCIVDSRYRTYRQVLQADARVLQADARGSLRDELHNASLQAQNATPPGGPSLLSRLTSKAASGVAKVECKLRGAFFVPSEFLKPCFFGH